MKKENKQNKFAKGFTLIEMLVVVLIIGILAAIALPQYREAVEKSIMQEALVNLKAIADANERFYMINGRYANHFEIDQLDVEILGEVKKSGIGLTGNRIMTKNFIYASNTGSNNSKAVAHRVREGVTNYQTDAPYYLLIWQENNRLHCNAPNPNSIQQKLCNKINREGQL